MSILGCGRGHEASTKDYGRGGGLGLLHDRLKLLSFFVVLVLAVPYTLVSDADAAGDEYYSYTIHPDGTIEGGYSPIGTSAAEGSYTSVNGTNSGSWAFNDEGYGPFNSFYAAFDPAQDNRMIGHLDPDDLTKLVDGTSIAGEDYNIMWCLPTVYWKTSGTSLVLTNDPNAGGTAYAHTINGHVYEYIGIGVYEASTKSVNGQTILTSISGDTPLVSQTRATFRDYANNQSVNTDGEGNNGYSMLWNFYQWELYKYCALAVMGSWDSQSVGGMGDIYNDGTPYYTIPGQHDKSGPYAGTKGTSSNSTYGTDSVKIFIENAWGSVFDFVDGIVINGRSGYYIDQSAVPTDATSGTYVTYIAQTLPGSGYGQSPCTSHVELWGMPTASGGLPSSGLYDYIYTSTGSNRVLYVGGYSHNGLYSGLSCVFATNSLSREAPTVGGRLAFVFDADPNPFPITVTFSDADSPSTIYSTQSVLPGSTVAQPESPSKQGYVFDGWYTSDGVEWDFSDLVQQDMTLYARWVHELVYTSAPSSGQILWARA